MKTSAKIRVRKGSHGCLMVNRDLRIHGDLVRLNYRSLDTEGTAFLDLARGLPAEKVNDITPADQGLTPGKLDLLETRLETSNLLLGSPRTARGSKTAATTNLATGIDEAKEILEKGLDKLVYQFRTTDFYQEYQSARKVINTATRHEKPSEDVDINPSAGGTTPSIL